MTPALDLLRARIADAPITVEQIRNEVSRQNRFVIFSRDSGEKIFEGRHEVTAAWIAGYCHARGA